MASRPVRSISSATSAAVSGRRATMRRAAPACTTITLRLCASTSWSSRAILERSDAIARRSSSSRACSARSAFSASSRASIVWLRIVRPASQGTKQKTPIGKSQSLGSNISTTARTERTRSASACAERGRSRYAPAEYDAATSVAIAANR
jgi:hypothetical protein